MSKQLISKEGVFVSWRTPCFWLCASPPAALVFVYLMSTEAAPQWFQAIGTVVAIGVTVWISRQDEARRRCERNELAFVKMENILSFARSSVKVMKEITDLAINTNKDQLSSDVEIELAGLPLEAVFRGRVQALREIDIAEISSHEFTSSLIFLIADLEAAAGLADKSGRSLPAGQRFSALSYWSSEVDEKISALEEKLDEYREKHEIII